MTTLTMPIVEKMSNKSATASRMKMGLTVAAAVAGAYGIGRAISERKSGFRQYKHRMEEWLDPRLQSLAETLGTTSETMRRISGEVGSAARLMLRVAEKAKRVSPKKRDTLEIVLDKRLVKMKMRIHKLLDLTEAVQAEALHSFYEELRGWLTPAVQ